jgi:hypothetical protein
MAGGILPAPGLHEKFDRARGGEPVKGRIAKVAFVPLVGALSPDA